MKIYTEDQLNRLCKVYQKVLRIQDWNIYVSLVPEGEIDSSGRHNSDFGTMCSHIRICNEESFTPRHATPELNMKQVLLHELVHLVLSCLGPSDKEVVTHELWENGIDRIACALDSLIEDPIFPIGDDIEGKGTEVEDGDLKEDTMPDIFGKTALIESHVLWTHSTTSKEKGLKSSMAICLKDSTTCTCSWKV